MATDHKLRTVEPAIWRACAGTSVQIPAVGSRVYYFPQGHAEQSSSNPSFSPIVFSHPFTLCRLLAVGFFANPETDEVFAKMHLLPEPVSGDRAVMLQNEQDDIEDENDVVSFSKILTPSDANNGGGFSVPRFCADSIFPPLNFEDDPPVQNLGVRDVHGYVWEFRHIYRGTPRRHLLTTGWSKFVNNKKLVAGDSVVFMRNRRSGEISVGIRRTVKANADYNGRWNYFEDRREREGFSRNVRGRVAAEAVEEAAEMAAKGLGFEVLYYPGAGSANFVVKAVKVEGSVSVVWTMGMRVKISVETEDSSRMTWFQGTVSSAGMPENGLWQGSPWRMLQVTWDEPEAMQNVKRVSPWQVEFVPTPSLHTEFPPTKKCRISQDPGLLPDGDGELLFPMTSLAHSTIGRLNPLFTNHNSFPASIQGARQDQIYVSGLSNFIRENTHQTRTNYFVGNISPLAETVSTELNIGSSQVENLSTDSQSSVHFSSNEQGGRRRACNFSPKVGISSFQLFGKVIHTTKSVEGDLNDVGCTADEGSKVHKERGVDNRLKHSATFPFSEFPGRVDIQCRRDSAGETCLF